MRKRLQYDPFLEEDLKYFIRILKEEAVADQRYSKAPPRTTNRTTPARQQRERTPASSVPRNSSNTTTAAPPFDKVCLYPPCGSREIKHRKRQCKEWPENKKVKLIAHYRKKLNERTRAKHALQRAAAEYTLPSPGVMFTAVFGGKVRETICADTCADANLA